MEKVRFGVIGLGNQGRYYSLDLFEGGKIVPDGVITAVCDIDEKKIEAFKKDTKSDVAYFNNYLDLLDSGLCDAILVETPHYYHPEIVEQALTRGIHVICDKPAGVYTKHVQKMNEIAKKSNAVFTMMFNQRTNCVYRKMKEIIANGGIGDLQRVNWVITNWFRTQYYYDSGSWRATWAGEGGGALINQCPHQLDLIQWIVGELPEKVNGFCKYGRWHDIEVEDEVTAYFEYKSGATGVFITSTGEAPGVNRLEISGTKGRICVDNNELIWYKNSCDSQECSKNATSGYLPPVTEKIIVETDGKNPQHAGIINNFINALLGKEELFVDGQEGIKSVELMNAIELSGWKGGVSVTLPVDGDEYLDELNKRVKTSRLKKVDDNRVESTANTFGSTVK